MIGVEKEMLDKHEQQLSGENGVIPRVVRLEQWRAVAEDQMRKTELAQQDLKNTVTDVKNTIVSALNSQTSTLDRVLTYSLEIKKTTEETDRVLINAKSTEKIARFSTTEKIIGTIVLAIFGTGGVLGYIEAFIK